MIDKSNSCGSSETTRKASIFNFDLFYAYGHAVHVPRISEAFLEWFIGFFEGDGSISWSKESVHYRPKNDFRPEKVYTRLRFSIVQKEKQIIELIAFTFGFGSVSSFRKKKTVYWRWSLESREAIERIGYLFNGNLILPYRQNQFKHWIDKGKQRNLFSNINYQPTKAKISLENGWLSGFIDAEGCFYANFAKSTPLLYQPCLQTKHFLNDKTFEIYCQSKPQLSQKMTLTQVYCPSTQSIFIDIRNELLGTAQVCLFKNKNVTSKGPNQYVRIELGTLKSQHKIITYLTQYPLKTIKRVSFRRWWRVYLRRNKGEHLSPKGIKRLYRLVKSINQHESNVYDKSLFKKDDNIVQRIDKTL